MLNFSFKNFDFWNKFPQEKYVSDRKQKKLNITIEFFGFKLF